MRNKKTLSIQNDVLEKGQRKADEMFSGNFSMYVTYLINKDSKTSSSKMEVTESIIDDNINNDEISCAIDSIIGMD